MEMMNPDLGKSNFDFLEKMGLEIALVMSSKLGFIALVKVLLHKYRSVMKDTL